jgi:hypothetical protein
MAFDRQAAINFLKRCTLCNGLTLEYPGMSEREGMQRAFLTNDAALMGTAFKMIGDPVWMLIRDTIKKYFETDAYYGATITPMYFYPIIDQAVLPCKPSFKAQVGPYKVYYDSGTAGDDLHPSLVLRQGFPVDNLSGSCCTAGADSPQINLSFMRALHHWNLGQTSAANTCYDCSIAKRPEGWWLADQTTDMGTGPPYDAIYKYRTYKQLIQWIAAKRMGRARLHTDVLDVMQDPAHGGVRTFTKLNHTFISPDDFNTETTALAVIADLGWNPP